MREHSPFCFYSFILLNLNIDGYTHFNNMGIGCLELALYSVMRQVVAVPAFFECKALLVS
jgi:hypothetical protein